MGLRNLIPNETISTSLTSVFNKAEAGAEAQVKDENFGTYYGVTSERDGDGSCTSEATFEAIFAVTTIIKIRFKLYGRAWKTVGNYPNADLLFRAWVQQSGSWNVIYDNAVSAAGDTTAITRDITDTNEYLLCTGVKVYTYGYMYGYEDNPKSYTDNKIYEVTANRNIWLTFAGVIT